MASNDEETNTEPSRSEAELQARKRRQADRGVEAEKLLNNPLLNETLDAMESTITESWKKSHSEEHEVRHNNYLMIRLLGNLRHSLRTTMQTGKAAEKELMRMKEPSKLNKVFRNGNR